MKTIIKTYVPLIAIGLLLACFKFSPEAQAVVPPPDGGYPGGNTAEGQNALQSLTTGGYNAAIGWLSLRSLTIGSFNTGVGAGTLVLNTGEENTATGAGALLSNATGSNNTAIGGFALLSNVGAGRNTAVGSRALFAHTIGQYNNAIGAFALGSDTEGEANNAVGDEALFNNTTGTGNTAMGDSALHANMIGSQNTAIGRTALSNNIAGSDITALGASAGEGVTNADHVICIGHPGANVSNSCYIGRIYGAMIDPGTALNVGIDSSGKLGTTVSSRRFKRDIKPMDKASDAILALKPVSFRYNSDTRSTPCFGLIAEEVAEVSPDLVVRDKNGELLSVRYDQVNAMLLNEFLKEHKRMQELEAIVVQQQKAVDALMAHTKEQDSKIQRVTDQLEMTRATRQVATLK
jgi:trimeric autotransporter adhesin